MLTTKKLAQKWQELEYKQQISIAYNKISQTIVPQNSINNHFL